MRRSFQQVFWLACILLVAPGSAAAGPPPTESLGRAGGLEFMRCDNSDKERVQGILTKLRVWPAVLSRSLETTIFQGWGWNGWKAEIDAQIVEPTPENIEKWNMWFLAKGMGHGDD